MKPRKATYLLHRWLGLAICIQLLAWSAGGFFFSVFAIENVRGEREIKSLPYEPLSALTLSAVPEQLQPQLAILLDQHPDIASLELKDRGLGPAWELRTTEGDFIARLDPSTGEPLAVLSQDEARFIALRDFAHDSPVLSIDLIEADPPSEYRKGVLPAFAVTLDHPKKTRLYVDAKTGRITARRNQTWRIFDFFWMLHTMDYAGRDNFNHPLLIGASVLAITASGSGIALWGWRAQSRLRSRSNRRRQSASTTA